MIKSMTGYGRGECVMHDRKFVVEIKSVNHRYNDVSIKIPRMMNPFEDSLRKKISQKVFRGKTDVYVSLESFSRDDIKINLNDSLSDAYVYCLREIQTRYNLKDDISIELIARFPDVITVEKSQTDAKILMEMWETLDKAADAALNQFIKMRAAEGLAIMDDTLKKLDSIEVLTEVVRKRAPLVQEDYRARLREKTKDALEGFAFDESRLLMEVALFADKSCIDEEITRMLSHISQMRVILGENEAVGRKLDFLVQEMNREVNTIGSKSNDIEITRLVVNLKSEVEKIREQIQNVE